MGGIRTALDSSKTRFVLGITLVLLGALLPLSAYAMAPADGEPNGAAPELRQEREVQEGALLAEAGVAVQLLDQEVAVKRHRALPTGAGAILPGGGVAVGTKDVPASTGGLPLGVDASLGLRQVAGHDRTTTHAATVQAADTTPAGFDPGLALVAGAAVATLGLLVAFWGHVKGFLAKALLVAPLYAHIERGEVFDNPVRERIFQVVKADPGVSATEVSRRAGVSWGTCLYHLNVLEQNRMVVGVKNGRYLRYFENGARTGAAREATMVLRNETSAKVADLVAAEEGLTQKEIADRLGMSPQALHWHLQRLAKAAVVTRVKEGRVVRHYRAALVIAPAPAAGEGAAAAAL